MSQVTNRNQSRREQAMQGMNSRNKKVDYYKEYGYQIVIGVFLATCVFATFMTLNTKTIDIRTTPVIDQAEIAQWNADSERYKYTFKNGENDFFDGWMLKDAKFTMANIFYKDGQTSRMQLCKQGEEDSTIIPDHYNFREEHSDCAAPIQNQGNCSSNYAVQGASVIADRFCLQSGSGERPQLNAQTYTSCDNKQRNKECGEGGVLVNFLEYVRSKGLLDEQCFPYNGEDWEQECPESSECEPHKIFDFCVLQKEENIKREIMTNGPVVTASRVFVDMLTYKSGVYQNVDGRGAKFGDRWQQWKIVGWGEDENETPYWIAENTWGESWGEEGLLRIEVQNDQSFFGSLAFAPRPRVEKSQVEEELEEFEEEFEEEMEELDLDEEEEDE